MTEQEALRLYTRAAEAASDDVIRKYSTSFGLATRLLGARHRVHVRNVYALVRVADEVVDGVAAEAGLSPEEQLAALDNYERAVHHAMQVGFSSDLVIHAFARTAREAGIDKTLTQPFFDSMREDLKRADALHRSPDASTTYDEEAHARYVHGSAEVVGLMCLRIFIRDSVLTEEQRHAAEHGACQLGAAFQNINFLRDLADDTHRLGRSYLSPDGRLSDGAKNTWTSTIRAQLADAAATIPLLPRDARAAVRSALAFFSALTHRIERAPAAHLYRERVRVPNYLKASLAARALITTRVERAT